MSLAKVNFYSRTLNMRTEVSLALPEYPRQRMDGEDFKNKYPENLRFPVAYLLNGFTGDYTDFLTMIPIERYAYESGMAIVIPSGLNTWYEDIVGGPHMYSYIVNELPAYMEAMFPVKNDVKGRFIAGLSMGGRGAAVAAVKNPKKYNACACLSAPLTEKGLYGWPNEFEEDQKWMVESLNVAEGDAAEGKFDYFSLVRKAIETGDKIPPIQYSIGTEDPIYKLEFSAIKQFVDDTQIDVRIKVYEGGKHDFCVWDPAIHEALQWFSSRFTDDCI